MDKMTTALPPEPARTLPMLDAENRTFWTSGADGRLRIRHCGDCDRLIHPPAPRCPECRSANLSDRVVSGRGNIESFTINHHRWLPGLKVPFVIAIVSLEEQADIRLVTNIVSCPPHSVSISAKVRVVFERHEEIYLPMFELEPGA